jgi:tetratricopeptide (TPR) repeat protein
VNTKSLTFTDATLSEFLAIDAGEYREKVRFVLLNREKLTGLSLQDYTCVINEYAEALFELGRFAEHIVVADELIELSIIENVVYVGEKDLYRDTLFQKAASLYNLGKLDEAIYILRELLSIDPGCESARLFLVNCHVRERESTVQTTRNVSIIMILMSACVIAVELLFIRSKFPALTQNVEMARNLMLMSGISVLFVGEMAVRYRAIMQLYLFKRRRKRQE